MQIIYNSLLCCLWKLKHHISFLFNLISWFNTSRYYGLLIISCCLNYLLGIYCHYLYLNCLCAKYCLSISSDGEMLIKPFQLSNDAHGFHMLLSRLDSLESDNIINLESMAHYNDNLLYDTLALVPSMCILNLIKTSTIHKNNICKTNTDKVDTYIIVKTLIMQNSYRFVTLYDLDLMGFTHFDRFQRKAIKQQTHLKIQLASYMKQVLSKLQYFFKLDLRSKAVYVLLKDMPSPLDIASIHMNHLPLWELY